jgi:hypothetical protein
MTAVATIGRRASALQRIDSFVKRVTEYLGRRPAVVVLFAEDYDSITDVVQRIETRQGLRIERGPSIEEYAP